MPICIIYILPGEGDSAGEGAVLVATSPVVYTDEDMFLTIVVVKPSTRQKVAVPLLSSAVNVSYQLKVIQLVRGQI